MERLSKWNLSHGETLKHVSHVVNGTLIIGQNGLTFVTFTSTYALLEPGAHVAHDVIAHVIAPDSSCSSSSNGFCTILTVSTTDDAQHKVPKSILLKVQFWVFDG